MADGSAYVPRLRTTYREEIRPKLKEEFGTLKLAWESLLQLSQAASCLSFALSAPSFDDAEIKQLHMHTQDMVRIVRARAGAGNSANTGDVSLFHLTLERWCTHSASLPGRTCGL